MKDSGDLHTALRVLDAVISGGLLMAVILHVLEDGWGGGGGDSGKCERVRG